MRIVLQRVTRAQVRVDGQVTGEIGRGLLLLLGVHRDDTTADADCLVSKCFGLRVFADDRGMMNRSLTDIGGEVCVVSQFTLFGDCRKGRRPGFTDAAGAEKGRELYDYFVSRVQESAGRVATGVFGAHMEVSLVNDGPVTLIIESPASAGR